MKKEWILGSIIIFVIFIVAINLLATPQAPSLYASLPEDNNFAQLYRKNYFTAPQIENDLSILEKVEGHILNHYGELYNTSTHSYLSGLDSTEQIQKKKIFIEEDDSLIIIEYILKDDKIVPHFGRGSSYPFYTIPNSEEVLIEKNFTIYKSKWENGVLVELIDNEELQINYKDKIEEFENEFSQPVYWGLSPVINPSGTYMLFYSDRAKLYNEDSNYTGSTWVKNFATEEEYSTELSGNILNITDWIDDYNAFIQHGQDAISLNVKTGDYSVLVEGNQVGLLNNHLIYQTGHSGSMTIQEINTGNQKVIDEPFIYSIGDFKSNENWVVFSNYDIVTRYNSILMYNLEEDIFKEVKIPVDLDLMDFSLYGEDTILAYVGKVTSNLEDMIRYENMHTYFINISDLEILEREN